jgi:hypothetical protein
MTVRIVPTVIMLILTICLAQPSIAETTTVKNGYIACEDLSALVLALKFIKEKKEVSPSDWQFHRCIRTENLSGLPVEIVGAKEGYSHLLLRAEKAGEHNFEFWTQSQAIKQFKPAKSSKK